jgi:hypothetical protein
MSFSAERLRTLLGLADTELFLDVCVMEDRGSYIVERLRFRTPRNGAEIRGFLTRPPVNDGPRPAILYAHAHGGRYEIGANELLDGRMAEPFSARCFPNSRQRSLGFQCVTTSTPRASA